MGGTHRKAIHVSSTCSVHLLTMKITCMNVRLYEVNLLLTVSIGLQNSGVILRA